MRPDWARKSFVSGKRKKKKEKERNSKNNYNLRERNPEEEEARQAAEVGGTWVGRPGWRQRPQWAYEAGPVHAQEGRLHVNSASAEQKPAWPAVPALHCI